MQDKTIYYYPKNLRAKTQTLLWDFSSFLLILGLVVAALFLFDATAGNSLIIPLFFAILTIKLDNITLLEKLMHMIKFMCWPVKFANSAKQNSTQKLIGGQRIDAEGIYTTSFGRYVMWEVSPHNLCVLSPDEIKALVNKYTILLSQCPNLETMAMDATSSIEHNVLYLQNRFKQETNPCVKKLLESDLKSISNLASTASTTRRYLFILKLPRNFNNKQEMQIRQYEKSMSDLGFHVTRLEKEDVKSVIANMLDLLLPIPDYDGLQFTEKED